MENFYGKKNDLNKMARILDQVKSGGSGAVLVSGPAGSGKTALVNRFAIKAEKQGALFCFAKADPLFFNTPFSTLARALNMLVKKAIGENPHDLKGMKKAFLKNFSRNPGPGLGTLLNLVPALSHLLGTKPNQTRDSGTRGGQSLNSRLLCLVESFASLGRPLILFLDDLQWMDPASHNFLTFLAINGPVPGFMPVLAFRSPNKENTEILEPTVTLYQKKEDTLSITLSGLTKRDTRGFLKQRLATFQNLNPLADICHEKTAGNPFYLIQLVDELLEKKAISQKNREWIYDLPLIAGLGFTDNIIELLIQRMQLLEKNSLALLKQAACIQSNITIALLKASSGFSEKKIQILLWKPLHMNLLQKNEDGYCFAHDKIKEALEKLLTDDEAHGIHSRLVEFFLADEHRTKKNIFILLFHYGVFAHTITCRAKRRQMVRLYLGAGKKARNQSAFALALKYFALGKAHFPGDIWAQDYDLALEFCRHMAECSYRAGDFAMAHEIFKETGTRARSFSHCLAVEMVKIPCYHAQGKGKEALEAGLGILRHLGIKIKKKPSSPGIIFAVLRVWARFVLSRKSRLIKKQMVPGTDIYLAFKCLNALGAITYHLSPEKLMPLVASAGFSLTLKHGHMEESPVTYIVFGTILNQITGTAKWGRRLGGLARTISQNYTDELLKTKEITLINACLEHWDKTMAQAVLDFENAARFCLRQGDHEYYAYNALGALQCIIGSTLPLETARQKIAAKTKIFERLNNQYALTAAGIMEQAIVNLEQGVSRPWILTGDYFDETRLAQGLNKAVPDFYFYKFCTAVFCGRPDIASQIRKKMGAHVEIAMDAYVYYYFHFLSALADISLKARPKTIKKHLKRLKKYAAHNPAVYSSKYLLALGASLCMKEDFRAEARVLDALAAAKKEGFLFEQALAQEYLGKIAKDKGNDPAASTHSAGAVRLYKRWGLKWKQDLFGHGPQKLETQPDDPVPGPADRQTGRQARLHKSKNPGPAGVLIFFFKP